MRAVSVVKRQSALAWCWLRCLTQGGDLAFEGLLIWNAAIEALAGEDRQF